MPYKMKRRLTSRLLIILLCIQYLTRTLADSGAKLRLSSIDTDYCDAYNPTVKVKDISLNCDEHKNGECYADDESFDIYGSFYLDKPYFKGSNSTSMTAQIKVEFMHRKTTLLIGDFCSIQAFKATSEDVTCLQSGLYTFVLENVQLPVEDGESVPNWFRLGMRAYLTIDFWEKNFKSYSMGCSKVEIGTSHSSRGSFEGFINDDIFIVAGICLGTFLVCGMGVIYWSGRAKRAEEEELRRARLMGEVVDWGVQIE